MRGGYIYNPSTKLIVNPSGYRYTPNISNIEPSVLINEAQKYGSTYELINFNALSANSVVRWLANQPITINNLITYYHCLKLSADVPMLPMEYSYIYQLNKKYFTIADILAKIYYIITGYISPISDDEFLIAIKARSINSYIAKYEDIYLNNDYMIDNIAKDKIYKRINYLKSKAINYWNMVGKHIYKRYT